MRLCKVIGKVDGVIQHHCLKGQKLLLVKEMGANNTFSGPVHVAADQGLGAGDGDVVTLATGSVAAGLQNSQNPVDALILAIMDHVYIDGKSIYSKKEK